MSSIKELLVEELRKGATLSTEYKEAKDGSKTRYKRNYYLKKLQKNNELNAKIIVTLERLNEEEKKDEHTSDNEK